MTVHNNSAQIGFHESHNFIEDVTHGSFFGVSALAVNYGVVTGANALLEHYQIKSNAVQDVVRIKHLIYSISNNFVRLILKTFFLVYVCLLGPIIEEWIFRNIVYSFEEKKVFTEQTPFHQFSRIFTNGLLFGALHLSMMQGWMNVCIFAATATVGIIFAALREYRKDWRASAVAHCTHNSTLLLIDALV